MVLRRASYNPMMRTSSQSTMQKSVINVRYDKQKTQPRQQTSTPAPVNGSIPTRRLQMRVGDVVQPSKENRFKRLFNGPFIRQKTEIGRVYIWVGWGNGDWVLKPAKKRFGHR